MALKEIGFSRSITTKDLPSAHLGVGSDVAGERFQLVRHAEGAHLVSFVHHHEDDAEQVHLPNNVSVCILKKWSRSHTGVSLGALVQSARSLARSLSLSSPPLHLAAGNEVQEPARCGNEQVRGRGRGERFGFGAGRRAAGDAEAAQPFGPHYQARRLGCNRNIISLNRTWEEEEEEASAQAFDDRRLQNMETASCDRVSFTLASCWASSRVGASTKTAGRTGLPGSCE